MGVSGAEDDGFGTLERAGASSVLRYRRRLRRQPAGTSV